MRVRHWKTGQEFEVVKINYLFTHPNANTEYILDDGRKFTNGEMWSEFVQVPEMNTEKEKE